MNTDKRIYLDYAAATPVDTAVLRAMEPYFGGKFGNPGSLHAFGQEAIAAVDHAREALARALGAEFRQIIFTASATEANNLALRGVTAQFKKARPASTPHLVVSAIEHESVLETARALEAAGDAKVTYVPVGAEGKIDLKNIKESLTPETALVSVMYANNEVGTMEPVREIAALVKLVKNVYPLLHTDAAQAFQFFDCKASELGVDLMTISSHKIYGPKGAGALYVGDLKFLAPSVTGGGQEFGLRSGTENVPAIVGFAKAAELVAVPPGKTREEKNRRIQGLREELWAQIKSFCPEAVLNGPADSAEKLPNILNVYFPARAAQDLLTKFDLNGLAASSGSACRSRALESSYVIESLGYSKERAKSSIRFSLGRPTTREEVLRAAEVIKKAL
ncbi:MAG TPA: cysteine desulfurase family protein [Candidatus Paceibacterota bacterium]|nr:cysteine desulfurase family protein [Candidatus Paceibacterota bacterium]